MQPESLIVRKDKCGFCDHPEALMLARVDYWDLAQSDLVKCSRCGLSQLDPMLTDEIMDVGCTAFYRMQHHSDNPKSIARGFMRSFRYGVAFATRLKLGGIHPRHVLEVGAGDGYFSRGMNFVFPETQFTCLDLIEEVLQNVKTQHGFKTIKSSPEKLNTQEFKDSFDLIIARDVIEHLANPSLALKNFSEVLSPGGYLHFITPNGVEDYWGHFCQWSMRKTPSQLLLNHVNYFNPQSLKTKLNSLGFTLKFWFTYDFKGYRQGYGRTISSKYFNENFEKKSARETIETNRPLGQSFKEIQSSEVLNKWWIKHLPQWVFMTYCFLKHYPLITLKADKEVGHELFGLAVKNLDIRK